MTAKQIIFDVGANTGTDSIPYAEGMVGFRAHGTPGFIFNGDAVVYAFEPTPSLVQLLNEKTSHLDNYHIINTAVSDFNGKTIFNIAVNDGCSSLLNFSEEAVANWPGRASEFVVTERIEVDVMRLDKFIEENSISRIDYLHVDTQGSDLNVLRGLGKYLPIVQAGVIEAAARENVLYNNQNTQEECVSFLEQNGFKVIGIAGHGVGPTTHNEVDIFFIKE